MPVEPPSPSRDRPESTAEAPAPAPGPSAPLGPAARRPAPSRRWWQRTVPLPAAAGVVGGVLLAASGALIVAHAWTWAPRLTEVTQTIGGVIVALLAVAAVGVGTRARPLADLAAAAALSLAAHGASIAIQGSAFGALLLGLAPLVAVVAHVAFVTTPSAPAPPTSDRLDIAWAIAKSRRKTAPAAGRAASPNRLAMHA
jgi:hypothetical protein